MSNQWKSRSTNQSFFLEVLYINYLVTWSSLFTTWTVWASETLKKHLFNINKKLNSNGLQYNKQRPYDQLTLVFCKTSNSNSNDWLYNQSKQKSQAEKYGCFWFSDRPFFFILMTLIVLLMKKNAFKNRCNFYDFFFWGHETQNTHIIYFLAQDRLLCQSSNF